MRQIFILLLLAPAFASSQVSDTGAIRGVSQHASVSRLLQPTAISQYVKVIKGEAAYHTPSGLRSIPAVKYDTVEYRYKEQTCPEKRTGCYVLHFKWEDVSIGFTLISKGQRLDTKKYFFIPETELQ